MSYQIQVPRIDSASILPNPVSMNTKFLLSVLVVEETITLEPYYYYSGDIYSGEVD